jgi:hypothetical protein
LKWTLTRTGAINPQLFFKNERLLIRAAPKEYDMDRDFFRLIDSVDELVPPRTARLDDEILICECFCVNAADIRELCETSVDLDLLKVRLNLGEGCRSCLKRKDDWIDKIF